MAKIHIHTKYSLLDAIIEPEELVKTIKEQDGDKAALCVTEHGNLYSDVEIYKLCLKYGVKYLLGCEMYICDDVNVRSKDSKYHHLVVIAKNEIGRLNLNKLVSQSCHYKYYGKPRIDFKMLEEHKEGLIVSSACMAGEVQRALMNKEFKLAKEIILKYKEVFGDDYYLEYQSHSEPTQQLLNRYIVEIAKKLGVKYIVTTDAHYLKKEDQKYHDIFVQIGQARETGETYNDCYVQSNDEILQLCQSTSKEDNLIALANTDEIADKCNVQLPLSDPILPTVDVPPEYDSPMDYLQKLCIKGWYAKKINQKPNKQEYKERLAYEMESIKKMGFEGYFVLVDSYANTVSRRGIARGSAGGSLVCYLTNITDIDPIEYGLYFERFIDVGALELLEKGLITKKQLKIPDVDSDFGKKARNTVLQNIIDKYGQDRVVNLGLFQYIWAKGAIKDIGRVLNIPFDVTNEMTSQLDDETIQEALEFGLLDKYKDQYPKLFEYANRLAGLPKSFSAHPCGKVVAMKDITYYNATDINDNGEAILQGDMHTADDLGLVKVDLLGLRTVDVIYDTLELIGKDYEYIAPHNLNFKDEKVYDNFRKGFTAGVFQFESHGMQETLKKMDSSCIDELIVANALFRPSSIKFIDNYADRKKGLEEYSYLHPDLEPILKDTYGIMVFQEQLIEIGRLAKLSNPDELRKATAKKKAELLDKIKPELHNGLTKRGWTDEQFDALWASMLDFAKYSFNKSHAAAYAIIAYICMYLKTYHPIEFISAWINSVSNKLEKIAGCVEEAKRLGIAIYQGKYNDCSAFARPYKDGIMMGTKTIKFCNAEMADTLMALPKCNSFIELLDNLDTSIVDTGKLNILIGLNYFSEFGKNRKLKKIAQLYYGIKQKVNGSKSPKTILPSIRECSQLSKDKIESYADYGITEFLVKKYSNKETAKLYKEIDNIGLLNAIADRLLDESMPLIEYLKFQKEYLQYVIYSNNDVNEYYYVVVDFIVGKDTTKPRLLLHNIKTGEEIKTRIKQSKIYRNNPFGEFSVLCIEGFTMDFKKKLIGGEWKTTDEREPILEYYEVIKE